MTRNCKYSVEQNVQTRLVIDAVGQNEKIRGDEVVRQVRPLTTPFSMQSALAAADPFSIVLFWSMLYCIVSGELEIPSLSHTTWHYSIGRHYVDHSSSGSQFNTTLSA